MRLYVAPVNSAGQGYAWARAAERLPGVGAVDMQHRSETGFGFDVDYEVPTTVFVRSEAWQRAHFRAVSRSFTHVMMESVWPLFTSRFDGDVEREVAALHDAGVSVAVVAHGSDIRLPDRHAAIDEWSPFHDGVWASTPKLQERAEQKHEVLRRLGVPVFVSTPDLLGDWPTATVLPLAVDTERWRSDTVPLEREVPVVVHAPSRAVVKGTDLIRPLMRSLADRGLIEYREFTGVASSDMPALIGDADIVLEQFRIGTYSVAAVEAMASGRVVIGHVHDQVREHVVDRHGVELPVVQATPKTLESVVLDMLERREYYRSVAAAGADFARKVHDGRVSAETLRGFLLG
ncbi:glycosyltransferase [Microbacterium sp. A588]